MEIYKKYDDKRINSKDSQHVVITLTYDTGKYYHIYTKDGVKGLRTHFSTIRRGHRIGKPILDNYKASSKVTCKITYLDDRETALRYLTWLHDVDEHDVYCLSNPVRVIHRPNKPGAYTIHVGEYFYHGHSGGLRDRLTEHIKRLKAGRAGNPGLQEKYDQGYIPRITYYICTDVDAAKDLEYKMIRDDVNNPKMLNVVTYGNK